MSVTTELLLKRKQVERTEQSSRVNLRERYMAYAKRQEKMNIVWYLKVVIFIPCVIMVPSIFLMAMATDLYIWFVGLSILLFFTNVIAYIAETKSTFYVPLYHLTILIMILIPLILNLLNL